MLAQNANRFADIMHERNIWPYSQAILLGSITNPGLFAFSGKQDRNPARNSKKMILI